MTAGGVALLVLAVLLALGLGAYAMHRWQRRADQAPRAKAVTKDALERREIEDSLKRKRDRELADEWERRFGEPDQ